MHTDPSRCAASEKIKVVTVDGLAAERDIQNVGVLKIDAEGNDFEVIRGAAGLLRAHRVRFSLRSLRSCRVVGSKCWVKLPGAAQSSVGFLTGQWRLRMFHACSRGVAASVPALAEQHIHRPPAHFQCSLCKKNGSIVAFRCPLLQREPSRNAICIVCIACTSCPTAFIRELYRLLGMSRPSLGRLCAMEVCKLCRRICEVGLWEGVRERLAHSAFPIHACEIVAIFW